MTAEKKLLPKAKNLPARSLDLLRLRNGDGGDSSRLKTLR